MNRPNHVGLPPGGVQGSNVNSTYASPPTRRPVNSAASVTSATPPPSYWDTSSTPPPPYRYTPPPYRYTPSPSGNTPRRQTPSGLVNSIPASPASSNAYGWGQNPPYWEATAFPKDHAIESTQRRHSTPAEPALSSNGAHEPVNAAALPLPVGAHPQELRTNFLPDGGVRSVLDSRAWSTSTIGPQHPHLPNQYSVVSPYNRQRQQALQLQQPQQSQQSQQSQTYQEREQRQQQYLPNFHNPQYQHQLRHQPNSGQHQQIHGQQQYQHPPGGAISSYDEAYPLTRHPIQSQDALPNNADRRPYVQPSSGYPVAQNPGQQQFPLRNSYGYLQPQQHHQQEYSQPTPFLEYDGTQRSSRYSRRGPPVALPNQYSHPNRYPHGPPNRDTSFQVPNQPPSQFPYQPPQGPPQGPYYGP